MNPVEGLPIHIELLAVPYQLDITKLSVFFVESLSPVANCLYPEENLPFLHGREDSLFRYTENNGRSLFPPGDGYILEKGYSCSHAGVLEGLPPKDFHSEKHSVVVMN